MGFGTVLRGRRDALRAKVCWFGFVVGISLVRALAKRCPIQAFFWLEWGSSCFCTSASTGEFVPNLNECHPERGLLREGSGDTLSLRLLVAFTANRPEPCSCNYSFAPSGLLRFHYYPRLTPWAAHSDAASRLDICRNSLVQQRRDQHARGPSTRAFALAQDDRMINGKWRELRGFSPQVETLLVWQGPGSPTRAALRAVGLRCPRLCVALPLGTNVGDNAE
jgi:hypothetical protein